VFNSSPAQTGESPTREFSLSRKLRLKVTRTARKNGLQSFVFEIASGNQRIEVPEHLMDSLRQALSELCAATQEQILFKPQYVTFDGKNVFRIELESSPDAATSVHIADLVHPVRGERIVIPLADLASFVTLLFEDSFAYPSGCLERVMSYHSLLQLAFPKVSSSLNATMGHRAGFLCFEITNPKLLDPQLATEYVDGSDSDDGRKVSNTKAKDVTQKAAPPKDFKSRLGIKTKSALNVNYDALLAALGVKGNNADSEHLDDTPQARKKREDSSVLDLGLTASQLCRSNQRSIRIRPDEFDLQSLRESLADNGGSLEFFLGFEIVDFWYFDRSKKIRAFRFPLYFMSVSVADFGAEVEVSLQNDARFYLNFLALADVIEKFSSSRATDSVVSEYFDKIQLVRFEFLGELERVRVERRLPAIDGIFACQRRALFGQEDSGPLAGALLGLNIKHVAIDCERTFFYPRNLALSEAEQALASDLVRIRDSAMGSAGRFNASLLGTVFNPVRPTANPVKAVEKGADGNKRAAALCNPYELPDSNAYLFDEIERKNLILVEGPPGTGKTFSMLNLLVHSVCMGKRVLVVSDKPSALDALYEKIVAFLRTDVSDEKEFRQRDLALRAGIKRPTWTEKSLDKIQDAARALKTELRLDVVQELLVSQRSSGAGAELTGGGEVAFFAGLNAIDDGIRAREIAIDEILSTQFGTSVPRNQRICSRNWHETTADEIRDLADFSSYLLTCPDLDSTATIDLLNSFIRNRQRIVTPLYPELASEFCPVEYRGWKNQHERLQRALSVLEAILDKKPQTNVELDPLLKPVLGTRWHEFLTALHIRAFGPAAQHSSSGLRKIKDRIFFPLTEDLQNLLSVLRDELKIFGLDGLLKRRCVTQLIKLHQFLTGDGMPASQCLAWAILCEWMHGNYARPMASDGRSSLKNCEIGQLVHEISELQKQRTVMVKKRFALALSESFSRQADVLAPTSSPSTAQFHSHSSSQNGRDLMSRIDTEFERVVRSDSVTMAIQSFDKLKETVARCFPVWLTLKEHVSLALPPESGIFDIVIIDEATQCRVDDAIPLIYRAQKVIAVGDENQTVLQRSSVLDDFLFDNLELEAHLHGLGATSIKAAGSNFFGLLKGLKQSRILLDEHFRCPPEVIEYSNKYVYDNMLKIMKWQPIGSPTPVVVDYSERRTRIRNRPTSGKYKGIEVGMIDRFFDWIEESILEFEKETGRKIKLETDVAICYFLLKNEEYVKERKAKFLRSIKRGDDVLDGAGAALQGKERDLIFFLWDITRPNLQAFMQGDDPSKRKGELNVLMSRPRLRAYHYLHKDFATLDHSRSSITHYLWSTFKRDEQAEQRRRREQKQQSSDGIWESALPEWSVRSNRPTPTTMPWRRTDGQLIYELLRHVCAAKALGPALAKYAPQFGVVIGRPEFRVDLILNPPKGHDYLPRIAFVELSAFESKSRAADLVGFASLLGRASPAVEPVFLHIHELFRFDSVILKRLSKLMIDASKTAT
jgi:hypothetical protein